MDPKSGAGPVPPYEPYPGAGQQPQHTGSYNNGPPSAPMSEADMYPTPQHTGTPHNYPHDPMGSPPPGHEQSYGYPVPQPGQQQPVQTPPISHQNSYGIQPSQPALAHVPTGNEKHEYQINQAGMQSPPPQPLQHQGSQPLQQGQYNAGAQQKSYQTATPLQALNRSPAPVDCPCCHARALTVTKPSTGNMTHIWGFICFITVCCCCIPYLIDATKDVEHKCGHCGVMLAVWHRGSGNAEVLQHS